MTWNASSHPRSHVLTAALVGAFVLCTFASGCRYHLDWPDGPIHTRSTDSGAAIRLYRIGDVQQPNYHQRLKEGRVATLSFDIDTEGQPGETVNMFGAHPDRPHFVIILDGIPFDLVKAMYEEGRFRLFSSPSRIISVFPAMTDTALSRVFQTKPCLATEALFFDRDKNALSNGNDVYLSGENAPWTPSVDYHAPQNVAVNTYLSPWSVFSTELREMHRLFQETDAAVAVAYSVGTAGIGTREGEKGLRACLREIDKLCERITYDRRGKVRFSILADHGHTLEPCRRVSFRKMLAAAGFRVTKSLTAANDVVVVSFGIVTYAQLYTDRPRSVAAALVHHPAVDLALYREDDRVIAQNADGLATIQERPTGFVYDASNGDPLALAPIIDRLRAEGHVADDGTIADRPLLAATADHKYPDPLHRIWSSFNGLVVKPADVIVSLKPDACHGSKFFHFFVAPVASTHGSLDDLSSVTFLLTNARADVLPDILRVEDVLKALDVQIPSHNQRGE